MTSWLDERLSALSGWEGYSFSVEEPTKRTLADLDANENWHIPEMLVRQAAAGALRHLDPRRYPEGAVEELRSAIGRRVGVTPESVVPCSGGDQAIDLLCQGFLRQGDMALIVSPTFSMYRLRATLAGANCVEIEMRKDFSLPLREIGQASSRGGILFICSPNNPTGNQFKPEDVMDAIKSFPGLVVLDEAYVEFARFSLSKRVTDFQNLAVVRTFSKAFGMAGFRLGYILANDSWAQDFLTKVQYPYPVNGLAVATSLSLMQRPAEIREWCARVKRERSWLSAELEDVKGVRALESQANFIMVSFPIDSSRVHAELLRKGVATRNVGAVLGLRNCLRITVGTRRMNLLTLKALKEVLGNAS